MTLCGNAQKELAQVVDVIRAALPGRHTHVGRLWCDVISETERKSRRVEVQAMDDHAAGCMSSAVGCMLAAVAMRGHMYASSCRSATTHRTGGGTLLLSVERDAAIVLCR